MERYQPDQYGRMMPDAHGQWVSLRSAEITALDAAQKSSADAQATIAALEQRVKELKQWVQDQSTANIETMRHMDEMQSRAMDAESQLTQRTAELEAAKRGIDTARTRYDNLSTESYKQIAVLQAELERVRDQYADLRKMVLALPKVEAVPMTEAGAVKDPERCPRTKHVDGKSHGWLFWGDDPYIKCDWCGEIRDALTGRVVK